MPKNPHPPRGSAKKPAAAPAEPAPASKQSSKKSTNAKDAPAPAAQNGKTPKKGAPATAAQSETAEAPKKPDVRTVIGGASWTGKLPVNLLSEKCQKLKWEKPDYDMRGNSDRGFVSSVKLAKRDPKTRELTVLENWHFPKTHAEVANQPTALEARHFAAAWALFRLCNMTNMHMMLPPKYKDLWKGVFTDIKKESAETGQGWHFEADPFAAIEERERIRAAAAKRREEIEREKAKAAQAAAAQPNGFAHPNSKGGKGRNDGWDHAVEVDMGKRVRLDIESIIRAQVVWNPSGTNLRQQLGEEAFKRLAADMVYYGFRPSHIEEALELCKDKEEAIEWLLVHVPEEDLPAWAMPSNYIAGVAMASSDVKKEATLKRLALAGFSKDLCEEVLSACNGNEPRAAAVLQAHLVQPVAVGELAAEIERMNITTEAESTWDDEVEVLSSIYGDEFRMLSKDHFTIGFQASGFGYGDMTLHVRRPFGDYPHVLPIMTIAALYPSYIRLSILQRTLKHCQDNFLGEQMIYNIIDWLTQNVGALADNPGRLADIASAMAASSAEITPVPRRVARSRKPAAISYKAGTAESKRLLEEWRARHATSTQQNMLAKRRNLPAWQLRIQVVSAVENHQVTIISGETGSGKSTQSVQFVLDDMIQRELGDAVNILCTQPRRISALGLADRVSDERCSEVGGEVGYIIRGESKHIPGRTKITFMTTGVLLRRLQIAGDGINNVVDALADVSHVVVDEVHERNLDTDFLLILLREVLRRRKDLRVVLMSATLDADMFESYFACVGPVAKVEIHGRTYPVDDYFLDDILHMTGFRGSKEDDEDTISGEDASFRPGRRVQAVGMQINYELIAQTVRHIDRELGSKEGGILIFLPGAMEIDRCIQALRQMSNIYALPLHASLMSVEQRKVFPPAPRGLRKVIACTNVAETSITIEDIVAVIDTGRVKETSFDPQNNMVKLEEVWASRAACKQRRGRAGRVQAGKCYKLFTRNAESRMQERPEPEMRRVPLEQLCLSVKAMGMRDAAEFLASALTPPDSLAVDGALQLLRRMGALDGDDLTGLGRHLAIIPADLRCGKLLVFGSIFGCLDACVSVAAILSTRSPFVQPRDKREEAQAARAAFSTSGGGAVGDLITDLRGYEQWSSIRNKLSRNEVRVWCNENFLSPNTLFDIASTRTQLLSSLKEIGFLPISYRPYDNTDNPLSKQGSNNALLCALIAGAFSPQIARIGFPSKKYIASVSGAVEQDPEARTIKFFTRGSAASAHTERVFLHPSSTLFSTQTYPSSSAYVSYFEKIATSKVFMRSVTPFNVYSLLLFCGKIEIDTHGRGLVVDDWLKLRGWARIGVLVSRLRLVLDGLLTRKIDDPGMDLSENEVVAVVRKLVELNGMDV